MAYLKTINVSCFGATHLISVTERGELVFHDHSKQEIKSELCLTILSGECRGCAGVLRAWRAVFSNDKNGADELNKIPDRLRAVVSKLLKKRYKRQSLRPDDPLALTPRERAERCVSLLAYHAVLDCNYRQSSSRWAGGNHNVFVEFGKPYIQGGSTTAWSRNRKWRGTNSFIRVRVDAVHWYVRVYKKDLAVVDGCFVLAHRGDDRYLVGRQSRGFDVKPWEARIVLGDDGKPHIVKWIRPAEIVLDENGKPHVK